MRATCNDSRRMAFSAISIREYLSPNLVEALLTGHNHAFV